MTTPEDRQKAHGLLTQIDKVLASLNLQREQHVAFASGIDHLREFIDAMNEEVQQLKSQVLDAAMTGEAKIKL